MTTGFVITTVHEPLFYFCDEICELLLPSVNIICSRYAHMHSDTTYLHMVDSILFIMELVVCPSSFLGAWCLCVALGRRDRVGVVYLVTRRTGDTSRVKAAPYFPPRAAANVL